MRQSVGLRERRVQVRRR